jgi:hypothetical protein
MSAQRNRLDVGGGVLCVYAGDPSCQQQGETPLQGKEGHCAIGDGERRAEGNVLVRPSDHGAVSAPGPSVIY